MMFLAWLAAVVVVYTLGMCVAGYFSGRAGLDGETQLFVVGLWPIGIPLLVAQWFINLGKRRSEK